MLAHFVRILVQCAPAHAASSPHLEPFTVVAVQLLQTLSILVQNTRRETSIYYLFSNNYINDLMELKQFDYGVDEEVLAWYISFLKAISLRLNDRTIQFFVSDAACAAGAAGGRRNSAATAEGEGVPTAFPLYSQVIRYVQHSESMVRAAARAATLNVFRVNDTAVRAPLCRRLCVWRRPRNDEARMHGVARAPQARNFVLSGPEHGYFASLAASLVEQTIALSEPFASALPGRWSAIATAVAKLGACATAYGLARERARL
jgi:protein CLEC16A